jgi:predicted AAA+ superfamily ATPase
MKKRTFWIEQIGDAWERRSIIWLSGVRRVGKTFLSRSLADVEKSFTRHYKGIEVKFVNLTDLIDALKK